MMIQEETVPFQNEARKDKLSIKSLSFYKSGKNLSLPRNKKLYSVVSTLPICSEISISINSDNEKCITINWHNTAENEQQHTFVLKGSQILLEILLSKISDNEWTIKLNGTNKLSHNDGIISTSENIENNKTKSKRKLGFSIVETPPIKVGIMFSTNIANEWIVCMNWGIEIKDKITFAGLSCPQLKAEINLSNDSDHEWTVNINAMEMSQTGYNCQKPIKGNVLEQDNK